MNGPGELLGLVIFFVSIPTMYILARTIGPVAMSVLLMSALIVVLIKYAR